MLQALLAGSNKSLFLYVIVAYFVSYLPIVIVMVVVGVMFLPEFVCLVICL